MPPTSDRWLSVDEYAVRLHVDRQTVYRALKRGEIPHRRTGRKISISPAALEQTPAARQPGNGTASPAAGPPQPPKRGRPRKRQLDDWKR